MAKLPKRRHCSFESLESRLPFAIGNDAYEPNNSFATAAPLGNVGGINGGVAVSGLTMNDGLDYYTFNIAGGMAVTSTAQISFLNSSGNLDLYFYNSTFNLISSSTGVANSESIVLFNRAPGTYYLVVAGRNGATNPTYSLNISSSVVVTGGIGSYIDLLGASLTSTVSTTSWSQYIPVTSQVRNAGSRSSAAPFRVEYYLSQDNRYSADDFRLTQASAATSNSVATLAAGATSTAVTSQVLLPASLPPGWVGTRFFVVMRTDSTNVIAESNEVNNLGGGAANRDWFPITINPLVNPTSGFRITLRLTGMTAAQQAVFQAAADRWAQIIWGDLPDANYAGGGGFAAAAVDDILIEGSITPIDGPLGILGQAGPDAFRAGNFLPYHGVMEFDTADIALMTADGSFPSVILHEMGHVLGIGTIWDQRGLLLNGGSANPRFTGVQATWAHNLITTATDADVPVENTGGGGTADSHWRESIYGSELMTGYAGPGSVLPLSRLTAASLADLLYQVNIARVDAFTIPLVAGRIVAANPATFNSNRRFLMAGSPLLDDAATDNSVSLAYAMNPIRSGSTATNLTNLGTSSLNTRTATVSSSSRLTAALQTTGLSGLNQRVVTRVAEAKESDWFTSHKKELDALFAEEEVY